MTTLKKSRQMTTGLWAIIWFTLTYMTIASGVSIATHNWEFIVYIMVVIVIALAALAVHRSVGLSTGVLLCLSIWGLFHMIGGLVHLPADWPIEGTKHVLYSWWIIPGHLKFDNVVHTFGFATATWVCWQAIKQALAIRIPRFGVLTVCVLAGMGLGAFNEVIEFVTTLVIPNTNVGGYTNTGWDLICNALGSVGTALIIYYWPRPKNSQERR